MLGVKFDDVHSLRDLGMYIFTKEIGSPEPKINKVDIVGSDGSIDLTKAISNKIFYKDRRLSFRFGVIDPKNKWARIYSEVLNKLHGKTMKITLDDDPSYFYEGIVNVNSWTSDKTHGEIVIDCDVDPYKYYFKNSSDAWLWNPFSFIDGIAQTTKYTIQGSKTVKIITNSDNVPTFESNCNLEIVFAGKTYTMQAGSKKFYDLSLKKGENEITFRGTGNVSVIYREKRL